jgi:hypothetical protein
MTKMDTNEKIEAVMYATPTVAIPNEIWDPVWVMIDSTLDATLDATRGVTMDAIEEFVKL